MKKNPTSLYLSPKSSGSSTVPSQSILLTCAYHGVRNVFRKIWPTYQMDPYAVKRQGLSASHVKRFSKQNIHRDFK